MSRKETPRFGFSPEYVKDIKAAQRFYVEVLGLEVERAHPTFVQFENFAISSDELPGRIRHAPSEPQRE